MSTPGEQTPEAPVTEPYQGVRYLEDYRHLAAKPPRDFWDPIKYLPIWRGGFLSLGGQLRTRYELVEPEELGRIPASPRSSVLRLRGLVHADLRVSPELRLFVQLGSAATLGSAQEPTPPDADRLDITQLFLQTEVSAGELRATVRVGRQEMPLGSTKWVGTRDGANVRQSFDLARLTLAVSGARLEIFGGGVPRLRAGSFDNALDLGNRFWGTYATVGGVQKKLTVDAFYLGRVRPGVSYAEARGREIRHTVGVRLAGELPIGFRYVGHALLQRGAVDGYRISAWGFATGLWQRLPAPLHVVELGLRGDALSGDQRAGDGKVGTFHPLFPNQSFFSNYPMFYPSNIYALHPLVRASHGPIGLELGAVFFWRQSRRDFIFKPPGVPAFDATAPTESFIATQSAIAVKYEANRHLVLDAEYSRVFAGRALAQAGGRSVNFFGCWTTYTF